MQIDSFCFKTVFVLRHWERRTKRGCRPPSKCFCLADTDWSRKSGTESCISIWLLLCGVPAPLCTSGLFWRPKWRLRRISSKTLKTFEDVYRYRGVLPFAETKDVKDVTNKIVSREVGQNDQHVDYSCQKGAQKCRNRPLFHELKWPCVPPTIWRCCRGATT